MTILSTLKSTGRAAILAIALGATALTAAPAYAQRGGGPGLSFELNLGGGGGGFSIQGGDSSRRGGGGGDFSLFCLSNSQIRSGLRDYGFRNVDIGRSLGNNRVRVTARYDGDWYSMRVNRCTGRVDQVRRD
jgi:hypothetical protein